MSREEPAVFSFELNESLYFDKGQEVAELRTISLDPEISIQSFHEYISIRGVIELSGEYVKVSSDENEEEPLSRLEEMDAKRYVENVTETEDGFAEFSHRFPVEISVPAYRVRSLDDVSVSIDSFDYELPEESKINLYATISIHGLQEDVTFPQEDREKEAIAEVDDVFEFEQRQPEEEPDSTEEISLPSVGTNEETEEAAEPEQDGGRFLFKTKTQSFAEFFGTTVNEEAEEHEQTDLEASSEETVAEQANDEFDYLSDLFEDRTETGYTKMRLCIVQKNDTIDTIAERFNISPLQLIKQNKLEDDFEVTEGQLLYIPMKTRQKEK